MPSRKEYERRYRAKRLAAGLCIQCKSPALVGNSMCLRHRDAQSFAQARIRGRRDDALCARCEAPLSSVGLVLCHSCLSTQRHYHGLNVFVQKMMAKEQGAWALIDFAESNHEEQLSVFMGGISLRDPTPDAADDDTRAATWARGASRGRFAQ